MIEIDEFLVIAQLAHEANRSYCQIIGDDSQLSWKDAPEWQKVSALQGVRFHFQQLKKGIDPKPSASHENWLAVKGSTNWKWGPVKDVDKKKHPCFVSYKELPKEQKRKDLLFGAIVKAFFVQV